MLIFIYYGVGILNVCLILVTKINSPDIIRTNPFRPLYLRRRLDSIVSFPANVVFINAKLVYCEIR